MRSAQSQLTSRVPRNTSPSRNSARKVWRTAREQTASMVNRCSLPVARAAHRPLLLDDALLVAVLPLPDALHQGVAADVVAGLALQLQQAALDHRLGGDAGVVGAGHPQRVVALHPVPADQQVLHHVVHGVPHVQGAGDVGQRHHHHVAPLAVVGDCAERARGHPAPGGLPLGLRVLVAGRQRLVRARRSSFGCRVHVSLGRILPSGRRIVSSLRPLLLTGALFARIQTQHLQARLQSLCVSGSTLVPLLVHTPT